MYIKIDADEALQTSIWVAAGELAYWNAQIESYHGQLLAALDDDEPDEKLVNTLKRDLKDAMAQRRLANADMRRAAGDAMKTGLAERMIKISERVGGLLADAIEVLIVELDLTPKQEALVPMATEKALRKIAERQGAPIVDLT